MCVILAASSTRRLLPEELYRLRPLALRCKLPVQAQANAQQW